MVSRTSAASQPLSTSSTAVSGEHWAVPTVVGPAHEVAASRGDARDGGPVADVRHCSARCPAIDLPLRHGACQAQRDFFGAWEPCRCTAVWPAVSSALSQVSSTLDQLVRARCLAVSRSDASGTLSQEVNSIRGAIPQLRGDLEHRLTTLADRLSRDYSERASADARLSALEAKLVQLEPVYGTTFDADFAALEAKIDAEVHVLNKRIVDVVPQIAEIGSVRTAGLEKHMFSVAEAAGEVGTRLSGVEQRLHGLSSERAAADARLSAVEAKLVQLEPRYGTAFDADFAALKVKIDAEVQALNQQIVDVVPHVAEISAVRTAGLEKHLFSVAEATGAVGDRLSGVERRLHGVSCKLVALESRLPAHYEKVEVVNKRRFDQSQQSPEGILTSLQPPAVFDLRPEELAPAPRSHGPLVCGVGTSGDDGGVVLPPPLLVPVDRLQGTEEIPVRLLGLRSGAFNGAIGYADPSTFDDGKINVQVLTDGLQRRFPVHSLHQYSPMNEICTRCAALVSLYQFPPCSCDSHLPVVPLSSRGS